LGQLLGIAQRTLMVDFGFSLQRFSPRKLIPVNVKSLGDQILLKRIAANLTQPEVAKLLDVSTRTVRKWEHGNVCPTEDHWQALGNLLRLDSQFQKDSNPTPE
jgi:DNA-binding XRE family transcriptional regulator